MRSDRIFAVIGLLVALGYGYIAFTSIKAPFQYDPLGPESWPRILSIVAVMCCVYILFKPDTIDFALTKKTAIKICLMVVVLTVYAYLFEHAGFIISTAFFCIAASKMLGASFKRAIIFGLATGIIGYFIGSKLLALNLPDGLLSAIL